jgi:hypothetical protein
MSDKLVAAVAKCRSFRGCACGKEAGSHRTLADLRVSRDCCAQHTHYTCVARGTLNSKLTNSSWKCDGS